MCGNRVEELESRVQELEASVKGLTDELVECKVRIRELESAVDKDLGFGPTADETTEDREPEDSSVGVEMVDASADDPLGESETAADTTKTEADDTEDKTEESESDIIVA